MIGATTRQSHKNTYEACKNCLQQVSYYGTCNAGYDNFYCRKGKNNKCPKCQKEIRSWNQLLDTPLCSSYEILKDVGMSKTDFYKEPNL